MSFGENLSTLRKIHHLSQEQLAEKLDISRQAVSKWESGGGYPEMEKLLSICELFDCNMDILMKGTIAEDPIEEKREYDTFYNTFSRGMAFAVGLILFGVTTLLALAATAPNHSPEQERLGVFGVIILFACIIIAVPIFIVLGIRHDTFQKSHPQLPAIYTEEENARFQRKYPITVAAGVVLILLGVVQLIATYGLGLVSEESVWPVVGLLFCVMLSATGFVYYGIQKSKYDMEDYREKTEEEIKKDQLVGKVNGAIMLLATAIFLGAGFLFEAWHISWVTFPIGGILCGVVSVLFGRDEN